MALTVNVQYDHAVLFVYRLNNIIQQTETYCGKQSFNLGFSATKSKFL